jgi:hypothetical protein
MQKVSKKRYTPEEIEYIKNNFPYKPTKELKEVLNHSVSSISVVAHKLGLIKNRSYITEHYRKISLRAWTKDRERINCFKKGSTPWNKGKKLSSEHRAKIVTTFVKGNKPHNQKPIGTLRCNYGYNEIKYTNHKWMAVSRYNWEQVHGPVPKGMVVFKIDGDMLNDDISNLCLVSRKDLAVLNRNHAKLPQELKEVQILVNQIKEKVK